MGERPVLFDIAKDPYNYVMRVVFCRWKPFILQAMAKDGVTNFARFSKQLPITQKVLAQNLKVLEQDGLVSRSVIPDTPPRTEYRLTERGKTLIPLLDAVYDWGWRVMKDEDMPIDALGEMWHGYRNQEESSMENPYKQKKRDWYRGLPPGNYLTLLCLLHNTKKTWYGIEGQSYDLDTEGNAVWSPNVTDVEGVTFRAALVTYTLNSMPTCWDVQRYWPETYDEDAYAAVEMWTNVDNDKAYSMPSALFYTTDESTIYSTKIADVETYANQYIISAITGEEDLEATWDSYVDTVWSLGLQDCLDAQQSAYDRYLTRGQ